MHDADQQCKVADRQPQAQAAAGHATKPAAAPPITCGLRRCRLNRRCGWGLWHRLGGRGGRGRRCRGGRHGGRGRGRRCEAAARHKRRGAGREGECGCRGVQGGGLGRLRRLGPVLPAVCHPESADDDPVVAMPARSPRLGSGSAHWRQVGTQLTPTSLLQCMAGHLPPIERVASSLRSAPFFSKHHRPSAAALPRPRFVQPPCAPLICSAWPAPPQCSVRP